MTKDKKFFVRKRNGNIVPFDGDKIRNAMKKALDAENTQVDDLGLEKMALYAMVRLKERDGAFDVEHIQDKCEEALTAAGFHAAAKAFMLYREKHRNAREAGQALINYKDLVNKYLKIDDWRVKENATVTYSIGGLILSNSGAISANYWLSEVYDKEIADAHRSGAIHIHDLSMLAPYCAGWNLKQLIQEGLGGIPGKITSAPANHLSTLCNQMVNFLGIMQNEWAGAQAFSSFDTYLAPFVKAEGLSQKEVKQCIQSFIYGVNTPSRWGCVDTETEVLSEGGFKRYDQLKEGDMIYTWKDGQLQLNPVRKVIHKPFSGKLHSYRGRSYDQTVTPNHRMLVKKHNVNEYVIKKSEEIFGAATPYPLPVSFSSSSIRNNDLSDDMVMLAAMVYTDGSFDYRKDSLHKVTIHKSPNRKGCEEIKEVLGRLGLSFTASSRQGQFGPVMTYALYGKDARYVEELCGSKGRIHDRFMSMNMKQADMFLDVWAGFDGEEEKRKCQYDNDVIRDQLQQIAVLAGRCSHLCERKLSSGKVVRYVKVRKVDNIYPSERVEVDYDGIVWCPNVENGTAVFRKNGAVYISGQTQAPFSNITLDWTVPNDLKNVPAVVGGKEMDFTYGDCQKEMDMVNKAFIEIMIEGDANGRGFQYPIPTYSITRDFDWSETENNKLLFEMTAKYGTPYFSNYINSDMEPSDVRSMCCRLRLDLRELRKKSGGFFGAGESTGSIGVVTINMPRIAYLAEDEADFYKKLDKLMDISARSLKIKRTVLSKLLDEGLYPYTKRYLGSLGNHFSTIGLIGMNEAGLNAKWLRANLTDPKVQKFTKDVLNHMRERLSDYQEEYGDLYNLEATPAESTTYRFAKHDKELYPDIITANDSGKPYYTNSSHLPVDFTDDIFTALDIQDDLQTLYTSGTVFHAFLGEKLPGWQAAAALVRKIAENYRLPYYTMSPTYSVCKDHGYIAGEHFTCPICGNSAEVYSRITGYYRPVQNWNEGKSEEFKMRRTYAQTEHMFDKKNNSKGNKTIVMGTRGGEPQTNSYNSKRNISEDVATEATREGSCCDTISTAIDGSIVNSKADRDLVDSVVERVARRPQNVAVAPVMANQKGETAANVILFKTKTCPNCKAAETVLRKSGVDYTEVYADDDKNLPLVVGYQVMKAPTLVVQKDGEVEKYVGVSDIAGWVKATK